MEREKDCYAKIVEVLCSSPEVNQWTKIEFCRLWTIFALDLIRQIEPELKVEAVEVDIDPLLQHTFVKIDGVRPFLCDGTGTLRHKPYFGFEDEAPEHLRNSRPDKMINAEIGI